MKKVSSILAIFLFFVLSNIAWAGEGPRYIVQDQDGNIFTVPIPKDSPDYERAQRGETTPSYNTGPPTVREQIEGTRRVGPPSVREQIQGSRRERDTNPYAGHGAIGPDGKFYPQVGPGVYIDPQTGKVYPGTK